MYGKYKHTVDPKGRLFVPSKLRDELGEAFYVTLGLDHCLSVYTETGWQAILDKYNALPISQARKMRFLFANAAKCEPDKQGRFLIPTELRQYAGIRQEVLSDGELFPITQTDAPEATPVFASDAPAAPPAPIFPQPPTGEAAQRYSDTSRFLQYPAGGFAPGQQDEEGPV